MNRSVPAEFTAPDSTVLDAAPRFAQRRARQKWAANVVALALAICFPQYSAAVTILVNTTQQGVTTGQCSLQEAIYATELKANEAIGSTDPDSFYTTGCVAGTGNGDTIVLPPAAVFSFDQAWDEDAHNIYGPTATPVIFPNIIIEGNGATLQWVSKFSPGNSRLFAIGKVDDPNFASGTGALTLMNVYVKGFHIKGGDGRDGGGGGLGAGGAIYVGPGGSLTVENSTFEGNGAVGGNGGANSGGGGGGLSGNGGEGCHGVAGQGGGGGGGPRGDGGQGTCVASETGTGGGGGGTVSDGGSVGSSGGFRCGGGGGGVGHNGHDPACPGGGGGGGGSDNDIWCGLPFFCFGRGAQGSYGGGAAAAAAMVDTAASAVVVALGASTRGSWPAGTAALEGVAEPQASATSLATLAKRAVSAGVPTRLAKTTAAAAQHWAEPSSVTVARSMCTTAHSSTIT
jgi:hypothetical protein